MNNPKIGNKADNYKIIGLSPTYRFIIYGLVKRFVIKESTIYIEEGVIKEKEIKEKVDSIELPPIEPKDILTSSVIPNLLILYRDNIYEPSLVIINGLRKEENKWVGDLEGSINLKGLDITKERAINLAKQILKPAPYYYLRNEGKEYALPFKDGYYKWSKAIEI